MIRGDSIRVEKCYLIKLIDTALEEKKASKKREELKKCNESYDSLLIEIQDATFEVKNFFEERIESFANIKLSDKEVYMISKRNNLYLYFLNSQVFIFR